MEEDDDDGSRFYKKNQNQWQQKSFATGEETSASSTFRLRKIAEDRAIDAKFGYNPIENYAKRVGYLINMHQTEVLDEDDKRAKAALDLYFVDGNDGDRFKATVVYFPYFYVHARPEAIEEVRTYLGRRYDGYVARIDVVDKEDLDLANHLSGLKRAYLKLQFCCNSDMYRVRGELLRVVKRNKRNTNNGGAANEHYMAMLLRDTMEEEDNDDAAGGGLANFRRPSSSTLTKTDHTQNILDIREHDVPYHVRVSIDAKLFCGTWYDVESRGTKRNPRVTARRDLVEPPELVTLAFDIETTKPPLKFPDAAHDRIMMISYMIDGRGYLITNREIVAADIDDFEYTPKPEYEGKFSVSNEPDERSLIARFIEHIVDARPHVIVTYNGDQFDWPFVEARASLYDLDLEREIGFARVNTSGAISEGKAATSASGGAISGGVAGSNANSGFMATGSHYESRAIVHMDCLCWVRRDSYLPVGGQSLKAVARAKLRYDPVELDAELMCPLAASDPQQLATYSVSDAVATYYLYAAYVHPFVFALATIVPLRPDEVLRKGSGTLCECILMVEASGAGIIYPNKHESATVRLTEADTARGGTAGGGHVVLAETYVGGHVEALESGVFRADIACRFRVRPEAIDALIARVAETVEYALEAEGVVADVRDVEAVESDLVERLRRLRAEPCRTERPLIYHLDVGAMYPNIILTNRLQPAAIIADVARRCGACAFNGPRVQCRRAMTWTRRVEFMPATKNEHQRIRLQLEMEKFPPLPSGAVTGANKPRAFYQLPEAERERHVRKRLETYCRKVYRRQKVTRVEERTAHVCQKENAFYVDTVRAFRDRRYEYKALAKRAKQAVAKAMSRGGDGAIVDATELKAAKSREIVYDSLQLAHKCILNSFYGYVMRKGARWYSMEMAGIVCHTGASIIRKAREIVEQLGRPLELDTDGIWCILPQSFPETFSLRTRDGKVVNISYPNAVLNAMVKEHFTNDQYHELVVDKEGGAHRYVQRSENTVFFEVDGPYRAMVLPASKVEDKLIKKRYAVFNFDGTLAELKGFEVKRRGELQLIKNFQSSVFEAFLKGTTLESCYAAVAQVADYWLDVLYSRGRNMPDAELMALLSEHRNMSKRLSEYGGQKSTSISTARRLAEFLGDGGGEEVGGGNLTCKFIISRKPEGAPVTDRAIPTAIFQCDDAAVQRYHLRRWLKDDAFFVDGATDEGGAIDIRDILDWSYYIERLGGAIQKIVTIPAAVQGVANPVPRVAHPDWLYKRTSERNQNVKQPRIDEMFRAQASASVSTSPGAVRKRAAIDGAASADTDGDIEDLAAPHFKPPPPPTVATVAMRRGNNNYKRKREFEDVEDLESRTWREVLGPPPAVPPSGGEWTRDQEVAWLRYHKRKWRFQAAQRRKLQSTAGGGEFKRQKVALVRAPTAAVGGGGVSTMDAFIDRSQRSLLTSTWHILQIAPIRGGGGGDLSANFQLWAFVKGGAAGGELHRVKLRVPKIFYVNSRRRRAVETTATYARCGARHLPHGAVPLHLYRHSIGGCRPDYDAVSASSSNPAEDGVTLEPLGTSGAPKDTFSIWLDGAEGGLAPLVGGEDRDAIAGVYELETPPLFRALVHCGCACRVVDKRRRPLSGGGDYSAIFDLDELEPVATSDGQYRDYLSDSGPTTASPSAIKRLYLYHHRSGALRGGGATQRQIFALFLAPVARALLIVVDSVRTNLLPNVATLYEAERLALQQRNPELPLPPAALRFEVRVETDVAQAYKLVERALQRYKEGGGGATLLAIQAADETRTLVERMPFIAEFPTCKVHIQDVDDLYDTLQWQRIGARTCVRHYLNSEHVHHLMLGQSRYHRLPIGNVERDIAIHATDVTYARHLKRNNHVWWCSPTDRPDLGRHSGAIVSSTTTTEQYQQQVAPSYREIINSPGRYGSSSTTGGAICFELEIDALPITAILQSHRIAEYEGNASYTAYDSISGPGCTLDAAITTDGDTGAIYRRASQCGDAFRVLRQMATALMRDVTVARNAYADFQVCHLYRWLRAPTQSLFYDGALLRMVELLVRKLTLQLLAELRAMGLRVVHASSNRVVVEVGGGGRSGFFGVDDALAKVEFVLASIRDKEVFHSLDITYKKCYHLLLWKDPANYASIVAKLPTTQEEEQEQQETAEEDIDAVNDDAEPQEIANKPTSSDDDEHDQQQQQPHVEMYWHVAESITTTGGGASNDRSSALLRQSFNAIIASYVHAIYTRQQSTTTMMAAIADETEKAGEEDVEGEFARALVAGEISQTLFRIVERTANQTDSESGAALALSFANCVCHVLRIDGAIVAAVDRLRANLHRLLRLDEYKMMTVDDGSSEWGRNYDDRAYILPQVICRLCNTCRDVDLKRDVHRAPIDGGGSCWLCHNCATPYEGAAIERALLDTIDAQLVAYVLQEYRCGGGGGGATSCGSGEVKRQLMTDRCECGARLTRTVKREKLVALVRTLREIGESSGCLGAVVEVASNLLARI